MGPGSPLNQIMERWNQLPRARQMALAGIVAGTIVVAYFTFIASSSPNLVLAFTGLAPEDSAAIADQLTKDGIPYEAGGRGSTISLPASRVAETRIDSGHFTGDAGRAHRAYTHAGECWALPTDRRAGERFPAYVARR